MLRIWVPSAALRRPLRPTLAMSDSITIRAASIEDSPAYESFMSAIFAENLDTLCPRAHNPSSEQVRAWMATHTGESSVVLLAVQTGQIIGTVNVSRFARPHLDHVAGLGLNVKLGYRGAGVGRSLLTAALAWFESAPQLERLELEVTSNNLPAIHLYRSVGFSSEGVKRAAVKKEGRYLDLHVMGLRRNG